MADVTITYKDSTIATMDDTGSKTLETGGTYCEDDIGIAYVKPSGGGVAEAPLNDINFFDYDGTILYSYSASDFASLDALPANPSHTGLTAQGWNWTLAQAKAQVAAQGKCDIGQMYTTSDGKSRIYCSFDERMLSFQLGIAPNGTVVVDWGDGGATDTLTGTSLTTTKYAAHTYSAPGDYVITLNASSGSFSFLGASYGSVLVRNATIGNTDIGMWLSAIKKIEIGSNASFGTYAFTNCRFCETITIPSSITTIPDYTFQTMASLKALVLPSGVTDIGTNALNGFDSIRTICFPPSITSIYAFGASVFDIIYSLQSLVLPSVATPANNLFQNDIFLRSAVYPPSATSIGGSSFRNCYSLESFTIPASVTDIGAYAFDGCYTLKELHFKPTTPPTAAASSAFTNIPTTCKIYVPTGSLSAYTSATNYPSSSTYTYVEE